MQYQESKYFYIFCLETLIGKLVPKNPQTPTPTLLKSPYGCGTFEPKCKQVHPKRTVTLNNNLLLQSFKGENTFEPNCTYMRTYVLLCQKRIFFLLPICFDSTLSFSDFSLNSGQLTHPPRFSYRLEKEIVNWN